jgi:hypothetical protein
MKNMPPGMVQKKKSVLGVPSTRLILAYSKTPRIVLVAHAA